MDLMMTTKYVTASQMKEIDRAAMERYGVSASQLMENAGKAVAEEAARAAGEAAICVFCGYGNNGGDGFVAARHLINKGYKIKVFLVGKPRPLSPETKSNLNALTMLGIKLEQIVCDRDIDKVRIHIKKAGLIIDAIFGIGIKGRLDGVYVKLIEELNSAGLPIISVDIPSGLDADMGQALPCAIRASKTVTLGFPKAGFKNPDAKAYIGELIVADIGLPAEASETI